ncbi:hypothetical protein D3C80_1158680 [compost metagenome]
MQQGEQGVVESVHNRRRQVLPTLQAFQDLFHSFHQQRPITDQLVTALGPRVMNGARNGVHLAALLRGQARRDQRAAGEARLNHQYT